MVAQVEVQLAEQSVRLSVDSSKHCTDVKVMGTVLASSAALVPSWDVSAVLQAVGTHQ